MNTDTNTAVATTETTTNSVGRPPFELKYPRGVFTVEDLFEMNRGPRGKGKRAKICHLTIRNHIKKELAAGFLTPMAAARTGKAGQPAKQFIRTAVKAGLDARKAAPVDTVVGVSVEASEPAPETPAAGVPDVIVSTWNSADGLTTTVGATIPVADQLSAGLVEQVA